MAVLAKQVPTIAGAELTMAAAAGGGDSFHNTGTETVYFANASGAPIVVTFVAQSPDNFGFSGSTLNRTASVPAGAVRFRVGPFNPAQFNDANGRVQMTYSGVTTFTVGVAA